MRDSTLEPIAIVGMGMGLSINIRTQQLTSNSMPSSGWHWLSKLTVGSSKRQKIDANAKGPAFAVQHRCIST